MFDGKEDEPHDKQEEGHYYEARIDFVIGEDEDGDPVGQAAAVHSHIHHVPTPAVVDTLLMVALGMVRDSVAESTFAEGVPEFVKDGMSNAFATMFVKQRIDALAGEGHFVEVHRIPDDISELFGDS